MSKGKTIWIIFDLGIKGDYENLYTWLDKKKAKSCGRNVALLKYDVRADQDLIEKLKKEIKKEVKLKKDDIFYVIWRKGGKSKGTFLSGRRKPPNWAGYGGYGAFDIEDTGD